MNSFMNRNKTIHSYIHSDSYKYQSKKYRSKKISRRTKRRRRRRY